MTGHTWRDWSCTVRVVVGGDDPVPDRVSDDAARIVRELMGEVEAAVSRFRSDSELERVNAAAPRLLPVGPLTQTLVEAALDAARRTDGAVDPTIGGQLVALGYDADLDVVRERPGPTGPTARAPRAGADWTRVVVDHDLGRVGVARGLRLDLGATAKAWTADEAARRVSARLRRPALVEIGGDVAVAGSAGSPWRVRVAEAPDRPGEVVGLTHGGLATSSSTVRRWRTGAGPAHHVVDPATGRPTDGPFRTATVWAPSAVEANTFSTAALVWGEAAAARLALAGVDARLVDRAGAVRLVGSWPTEGRAA
ncbi:MULTISPECIES: FAD:protein FMN transferase [unclassified Nocardioides]|uniref:FAD:protein FMN transferase n=1 Tax=unclassified Nocardioides TaxID=2615069 RepID=UPI0000EB6415|nr:MULTISPECIES: FAD:protein FMN transferase [unclassified Nocardioides]ABL83922.1 ApbE family lipoprotein [Nocardioides sp. JS614]